LINFKKKREEIGVFIENLNVLLFVECASVPERRKETKWPRPKPIIVTAGAMVKGVIYLSMFPMMPNQPITT
jgi:hypothetical protein